MTIVEKIYNMYLQNPNKVAIITEDKEINYNDFWINICKYASAINKYNLNDEDIIIFENTQDERFCYTLLAINLLGYIALPVDKNIPKKTINHLMKSVNAKKLIMKDEIIITEEMFMPKYFPLDDKICNILLSSGSTGDEKKIKYYHKTISNMISSFYDTYNLNDNNMIMITGPLSHAYSFVSMYIAFNYNLPFYIYNSLNIIDFISILEKEYEHIIVFTNPTFLHYLINLFYEDIKNIINKIDIINSATAPLNNKDVEKLLTIYDHKIYNHYGSTEGFSLSCIDLSKYEYKNGLVGIPMNNTMIEIVNEKNEVINSSKQNPGIVRCSGLTIAPGYYDGDNLNYFYTGDFGYFENDFLYLIDRNKNIFNINGYKVTPIEIENIALSCEGVLECICYYNEVLGLKIVVNKKFNIRILKDKLKQELLSYKIPKKIEIVDFLERNQSGKINRKLY